MPRPGHPGHAGHASVPSAQDTRCRRDEEGYGGGKILEYFSVIHLYSHCNLCSWLSIDTIAYGVSGYHNRSDYHYNVQVRAPREARASHALRLALLYRGADGALREWRTQFVFGVQALVHLASRVLGTVVRI